jgi:Leucine-rich repeat (LRR) protein
MKSKLFLLLIFLIQTELSFQMFVNKTVIYNKIFQSVTELNLNGMKIDYIDKKSFEDISKLKKLYLNNNLISFVDASMFEGMLK